MRVVELFLLKRGVEGRIYGRDTANMAVIISRLYWLLVETDTLPLCLQSSSAFRNV